jgi:hypothetical protein
VKLRIAWVLGCVFGVMLAANCSDPKTANGTSLYVTNYFSNGYKVRQLQFIGQNSSGNEVFQRDVRPTPAASDDLASPQTIRILLADNLADSDLILTVNALDVSGETVEFGTTTVKPVKGVETEATVNMKPFEVFDSGFVDDDGGPTVRDAGSFDASLPDGGVASCPCNSTCCVPDAGGIDGGACANFGTFVEPLPNGLAPLQISLLFCGVPKSFCGITDLCDGIRANQCAANDAGVNVCSCGSAGQMCPQGSRCTVKSGVSSCVCDTWSNCDGCCGATGGSANQLCDRNPNNNSCGAAGQQCEACATGGQICSSPAWGPGTCSLSTKCASCAQGQCCTGQHCAQIGWPTCRLQPGIAGGNSSCDSCELGKSDRCSPEGYCACGREGACKSGFTTCRAHPDGGASCELL